MCNESGVQIDFQTLVETCPGHSLIHTGGTLTSLSHPLSWLRPASRFDRHFQTHRTRLGRPFIAHQLYTRGPRIVISYVWAGVATTDQIRSELQSERLGVPRFVRSVGGRRPSGDT